MCHPGPAGGKPFPRPLALWWGICEALFMKSIQALLALGCLLALAGCAGMEAEGPAPLTPQEMASFFLPDATGSQVVSMSANTNLPVKATLVVQTHGVITKESGPKASLERFNEVYDFSPAFLAVHRDEPTLIRFWNLQPDDNHDFMLIAPDATVLTKVLLRPLRETAFVFTFHQEGLYTFICAMHEPSMAGQILVLPPGTQ
jgi:plastocyanin